MLLFGLFIILLVVFVSALFVPYFLFSNVKFKGTVVRF